MICDSTSWKERAYERADGRRINVEGRANETSQCQALVSFNLFQVASHIPSNPVGRLRQYLTYLRYLTTLAVTSPVVQVTIHTWAGTERGVVAKVEVVSQLNTGHQSKDSTHPTPPHLASFLPMRPVCWRDLQLLLCTSSLPPFWRLALYNHRRAVI